MAPAGHGFKLQLAAVCLVLLAVTRNVFGTGHMEFHFVRYTDNCDEDLGSNKCDPMFSFCASTPQTRLSVDNCNYASTGESSDYFRNTNHIEMEHLTSIVGHPNPWVVSVKKFLGPSVMLVIKVRDKDIFVDDHMQTWALTLTEKIWPTKEQSVWEERVMTKDSYTMRFKVRMYCDQYYYTSTCDKYCKPEDSSAGHYTCEPTTGDKICLPGWQGPQCTEDIDECQLGYCVRGQCINLPGNYFCHCPPNYTGKNCTTLRNPCRSQPCLNSGTCFSHDSEHVYICQCTQEWEGVNCEKPKAACQSNPCLNNGICASSPDKTSYSCSCVYPNTGDRCESVGSTTVPTTIPTSLETTTAPITTTTFTAIATTTLEPSTTIKMENGSSTPTSSMSPDVNVQQQMLQEDDSSDFQPWYIAIILAILVIVLVILAVFFIRRRKMKAAQDSSQTSSIVSFDGSRLAFENGMYTDTNRNNSVLERQTRQLPPVPVIPTHQEMFNPTKSTYAQVNETEGATGGGKADDSGLKKSSSNSQVKTTDLALGSLARPVSVRAETNPYADFKSLRDSQAGINTSDKDDRQDESQYHDLDDITASLHEFKDCNEPDDSSSDTLNFNIQDPPVVTVQASPYDVPSNNSSYYDSPKASLSSFPNQKDDRTKGDDLVQEGDLTNNFTPRTDFSVYANYMESDDSDDDVLQEDLAQLRKSVEDGTKDA